MDKLSIILDGTTVPFFENFCHTNIVNIFHLLAVKNLKVIDDEKKYDPSFAPWGTPNSAKCWDRGFFC